MGTKNEINSPIGLVFGLLTIVSFSHFNKNGEKSYLCKCNCGGSKITKYKDLKRSHTKSCGCIVKTLDHNYIRLNLDGQRFGRLVAVRREKHSNYTATFYLCKCDCGCEKLIRAAALRAGRVLSCGCLLKDFIVKTKKTHGLTNSKEYKAWNDMKNRCYNKKVRNYTRYGGRGIKVCERWLNSFENFFADVGTKPTPKHSIERRDNNQSYSPENCYWATLEEQANNKERSLRIVYQDRKATLAHWSRILNLNYKSTWNRIYKDGWSVEKAFATSINT